MFQFQIGAIKRNWTFSATDGLAPFQFQIGAIKSLFGHLTTPVSIEFQFQIGAIKSYFSASRKDHPGLVSIPNWCD